MCLCACAVFNVITQFKMLIAAITLERVSHYYRLSYYCCEVASIIAGRFKWSSPAAAVYLRVYLFNTPCQNRDVL